MVFALVPCSFSLNRFYRSRRKLLKQLEQGSISPQEACERFLAVDPADDVSLVQLGNLRLADRDAAEAEELF